MASYTYTRSAQESIRQISWLTNDMKDLSEPLAEHLKKIILERPESYYGYIMMSSTLTDDDIRKTLQLYNQSDIYLEALSKRFNLDFTWYDDVGRHIMVWGKSQEIITKAILAIRMWLNISA
jgi:hypothetical protein